jgi:hypothetical protein
MQCVVSELFEKSEIALPNHIFLTICSYWSWNSISGACRCTVLTAVDVVGIYPSFWVTYNLLLGCNSKVGMTI